MITELQAILGPELMPMLIVNGVAAVLGICSMIVALTSSTEVSRTAARIAARV